MNNQDLLKVAKALHGDAMIVNSSKVLFMSYKTDSAENYVDFEPTTGELIKWLLERGNVDISKNGYTVILYTYIKLVEVVYNALPTNKVDLNYTCIKKVDLNYTCVKYDNLKENLLDVVLQVIEDD